MQFYWLVARQSKSDIRNLTFMHNINGTSGTRQDQTIYGQEPMVMGSLIWPGPRKRLEH